MIKKNNLIKIFLFLSVIILLSLILYEFKKIKENCYPSERYHMAESYRPGGDYKNVSNEGSVEYRGVVRVYPDCKRGKELDIELWFADSKGFYSLDTRLKVKSNWNGEFKFKTGPFLKGSLPYHIHYKVSGRGIRSLTGTFYPDSENSGGVLDITVVKANINKPTSYFNKAPSSGESLDMINSGSNNKINNINKSENIIKIYSYILIIILVYSLIIYRKIKIKIIISLLLLFLFYFYYINYIENSNEVEKKVISKFNLPNDSKAIANWVPVIKGDEFFALEDVIKIPEQPNMFTQALLSKLDYTQLEDKLRNYYRSKGYKLTNSAVNQWGMDAHWVNGVNFSAIKKGNEVSITISKTLGDGGYLPEDYKSMLVIWSSFADSIDEYIVRNYRGYGEGFIDIKKY
jgi:hypothetical protein